MKIYVASSWRNNYYPSIVEALQKEGHDVYDFRNPTSGDKGFSWSDLGETAKDWQNWTADEYRKALQTSEARRGYNNDIKALQECELCVMVLPCGKSAHLELGGACGAGAQTIIYMPEKQEAELMYLMADYIVLNLAELVRTVRAIDPHKLPF